MYDAVSAPANRSEGCQERILHPTTSHHNTSFISEIRRMPEKLMDIRHQWMNLNGNRSVKTAEDWD